MTFLELSNDDWTAKVIVEVGFFQNKCVPSLRYSFDDLDDMNPADLKRIFEVAEQNVHAILIFDRKYDWDCIAYIESDVENPVTIRKCCCDDETDNPYIVEFPKVSECRTDGDCTMCDHNLFRKCLWE